VFCLPYVAVLQSRCRKASATEKTVEKTNTFLTNTFVTNTFVRTQ